MAMQRDKYRAVNIFYSYVPQDEAWCQKLETHLSLLRRQGLAAEWRRRDILAGANIDQEVTTYLKHAEIILLLMSPDFLASDYCYGIEMALALQRHEANEARVIPIILRPSDWEEEPALRTLQPLPINRKPIATWRNSDEALLDVSLGLRKVIEVLRTQPGSISSTKLQIWNVPHNRNPFFTGREALLVQIHEHLTRKQVGATTQPLAISGLGGIGKTQIALEYVYRYREEYQFFFWIKAATHETLTSDFALLAELLNLPAKDQQDQKLVIAAVKRWLVENEGWLLLFDNADDLSIIDKFLPPGIKGHILLTTQAQAGGPIATLLEVEKMNEQESVPLLLRRARLLSFTEPLEQIAPRERVDAEAIVKELDGLPLALDQAGAYIEETKCGLPHYLDLYRKRRTVLLKKRGNFDSGHPASVLTTFSLSFERLQQANLAPVELLRLCAFLSADDIPIEVITQGASELGPLLESALSDPISTDEMIRELLKYSLVKRNYDTHALRIHRLVQAVLQDEMSEDVQRNWANKAVNVIHRATPSPYLKLIETTTWPLYERYLPHVQACAVWMKRWYVEQPWGWLLLLHAGAYLLQRGRYKDVEPLLKDAINLFRKMAMAMDADSPSLEAFTSFYAIDMLAMTYFSQGKYTDAEALLKDTLANLEKVFRGELGEVMKPLQELVSKIYSAQMIGNLGIVYFKQEKYEEAELLLQRAVAARSSGGETLEEIFATGKATFPHAKFLPSPCNTLARLYTWQGRYEEAEALFQLSLSDPSSSNYDPHQVAALCGLGALYCKQERYEEAEILLQRVIAVSEETIGPDHPDFVTSLCSLAIIYEHQARYADAEPLYQRAIAIAEKVLGPDHPDFILLLSNLANLYRSQARYTEAELLLQRAVALEERIVKPSYSKLEFLLTALAECYAKQEKDLEAEALSLQIRKLPKSKATILISTAKTGRVEFYEIRKDRLQIGRDPASDILLEEKSVSRVHATLLLLEEGHYGLRDEGSTNGTKLYRNTIVKLTPHRIYPLQSKAIIHIGDTILSFFLKEDAI